MNRIDKSGITILAALVTATTIMVIILLVVTTAQGFHQTEKEIRINPSVIADMGATYRARGFEPVCGLAQWVNLGCNSPGTFIPPVERERLTRACNQSFQDVFGMNGNTELIGYFKMIGFPLFAQVCTIDAKPSILFSIGMCAFHDMLVHDIEGDKPGEYIIVCNKGDVDGGKPNSPSVRKGINT